MTPPADLLPLRADAMPVAGVELGGTKCVCILGYGPDRILAQETIATEHPEVTLAAIREILGRWQRDTGFRALGIASFGPICLDRNAKQFGHILTTTKPDWSYVDVFGRITRDMGVPAAFDTDVNGAALAEIAWGCAQGLSDFAYVTVGTGVGVGLIVNGRPARGILHSEIGHMRIPREASDAFPGICVFHADCVEGLASGSAVKARLGAQHVSDISEGHMVWEPVVAALAGMCHNMVCTTGPQRIAFGGGVISRQPHLLGRIEKRLVDSLAGYLDLPAGEPFIVAPSLGTQAGPLGAIALGLGVAGSGDVSAEESGAPAVAGLSG